MHRSYLTFSLVPYRAPLGHWIRLLIIGVNLSRWRCPQVWVAVIHSDNFSIMSITNFLNCLRIHRLESINQALTHGCGSSYSPQGLQSPLICPRVHIYVCVCVRAYVHAMSQPLVKQIINAHKKPEQVMTGTDLSRASTAFRCSDNRGGCLSVIQSTVYLEIVIEQSQTKVLVMLRNMKVQNR